MVAILTMAATAFAQSPAPPRAGAPDLRVRGPIKITAERAELEQRNYALYRGNVRLVSADLVLTGDRLELKQPARGQFEARVTGRPARLTHAGQGDAPAVAASAALIVYDTRTATVDLSGKAQLERGADLLTSDTMRYEVAARRISASGAGDGQVQIVIHPPNGPTGARPAPVAPAVQSAPPPAPEVAPSTDAPERTPERAPEPPPPDMLP